VKAALFIKDVYTPPTGCVIFVFVYTAVPVKFGRSLPTAVSELSTPNVTVKGLPSVTWTRGEISQ